MKQNRQKILDKVIKLLSLSKNNSNEAEATAAKDMAATLMAKYDISIIEAKEKSSYKTVNKILTRLYPIKYDWTLIQIISRFNGVAYVIKRGINRGPNKCPGANIFCGRDVDIELNDYMLEVVFQQRASAWKKYLKEYKATCDCAPKEAIKKEWMFGFMFGVKSKLQELTELKESKIQEYGLVPVNQADQAFAEYAKDNDVREGKSRAQSYSGAGYEAGNSTHIHTGIQAQGDTKLLN